jgi:hypothetical protein
MISVGAVVTEDTLPHSLMIGHPARLKGFVCRCGRKMSQVSTDERDIRLECDHCSQTLSIRFSMP